MISSFCSFTKKFGHFSPMNFNFRKYPEQFCTSTICGSHLTKRKKWRKFCPRCRSLKFSRPSNRCLWATRRWIQTTNKLQVNQLLISMIFSITAHYSFLYLTLLYLIKSKLCFCLFNHLIATDSFAPPFSEFVIKCLIDHYDFKDN